MALPRICFVSDDAWRANAELPELVSVLTGEGLPVEVAMPAGDRRRLDAAGAIVREIPMASGMVGRAASVPLLVAAFAERRPDLVHATSLHAARVAFEAAGVAGVPLRVASLERIAGDAPAGRRLPGAARRLWTGALGAARSAWLGRLVDAADATFALGRPVADAAEALGISTKDWTVLDNGMGAAVTQLLVEGDPTPWVEAARKRVGVASARFVVATVVRPPVGDLIAQWESVVQAAAARLPGAHFVVVVEGGLKVDVPANLRDRVTVAPDAVDRVTAMHAADVLLQPESDAVGALPVMEAAALRVPAVVADAGALPSRVEPGRSGVRVPAGDAAAFVAALKALHDSPTDREAMGARARQYALRLFDRDLANGRILQVYDGLLSGPQPAKLTPDGRLVADDRGAAPAGVERRVHDLLKNR